MTATALHQHYHALHIAIANIQKHLAQQDPVTLNVSILDCHNLTCDQIAPLVAAIDDPGIQNQVRSLHTEIVKQLKLLAMDVNFLRVAHQPTTIQQRHGQMDDRLQRLLSYLNSVMTLLADSTTLG